VTPTVLLALGVTLFAGVLISGLAARSVLSTAVLFLFTGILLGQGGLGVIGLAPDDAAVSRFTELALFIVLFTEGMRMRVSDLRSTWHLPGRALLVGMPITLLATAALGHWVAALPWAWALLLGAALSPTDPVFAATLVGREEVPRRLRWLLNLESGLNDGLALPLVVALLAVVSSEPSASVAAAVGALVTGTLLGMVVPWAAIRLEQSRLFDATPLYLPLNVLAVGIIVFSAAHLTGANEFLAAFAAGVTTASTSDAARRAFDEHGRLLAELAKLAALLTFGALVSPAFLAEVSWRGYLLAMLVLLFVRPIALAVALSRTRLGGREWAAAAWFGPKGFASVFYGLLILQTRGSRADEVFHLIAIVVAASIVVHSSTDVLVARWVRRAQPA